MTSVKKPLPPTSISFRINDNSYDIKYPRTGEMLNIESLKVQLSSNTYNELINGNTTASQIARITIDMIAFLSIMCKKLREDMKVETFSELNALDNKKLYQMYIKTILPWLNEWETILNTDDEVESEIK